MVTHGHVCVQQEHTQTELCQASSKPHQSLDNKNGQLPDVKAALLCVDIISPLVQGKNRGPEGLSNLPKDTHDEEGGGCALSNLVSCSRVCTFNYQLDCPVSSKCLRNGCCCHAVFLARL